MSETLKPFQKGDVIGIFDISGKCIGLSEIKDPQRNLSLMAFGDDPTNLSRKNLIEGHPVGIKAFIRIISEHGTYFDKLIVE